MPDTQLQQEWQNKRLSLLGALEKIFGIRDPGDFPDLVKSGWFDFIIPSLQVIAVSASFALSKEAREELSALLRSLGGEEFVVPHGYMLRRCHYVDRDVKGIGESGLVMHADSVAEFARTVEQLQERREEIQNLVKQGMLDAPAVKVFSSANIMFDIFLSERLPDPQTQTSLREIIGDLLKWEREEGKSHFALRRLEMHFPILRPVIQDMQIALKAEQADNLQQMREELV